MSLRAQDVVSSQCASLRAGGSPASECQVSRAGAGRGAARQRRGAHLEARGADSLLVLRHSQRPDGDARRRLLRHLQKSAKLRRR